MRIHWRRLIWVVFICLYSGLFFYNCFKPFSNWFFIYIYTMILIIWLCVEYYERYLFFQSGLLLSYNWALRAGFALFFYSAFIIGIATNVWWHKNRIGLYPYLQIAGIALLIYSIFLRNKIYSSKELSERTIVKFYSSLSFLIISLTFGYGSIFLIPYVIVVGFPLILLQIKFGKNYLVLYKKFTDKAKDYNDLQRKYTEYIEEQSEKKTKK